jgi:hypothetical protein
LRLKLRSFGLKWPKTHAQEGQICTPIGGQLRTPIDRSCHQLRRGADQPCNGSAVFRPEQVREANEGKVLGASVINIDIASRSATVPIDRTAFSRVPRVTASATATADALPLSRAGV